LLNFPIDGGFAVKPSCIQISTRPLAQNSLNMGNNQFINKEKRATSEKIDDDIRNTDAY